jgi:hypothetical protein
MVSSAADCVTYPTLVSFPSLHEDYWRIFWGWEVGKKEGKYENMYFWPFWVAYTIGYSREY